MLKFLLLLLVVAAVLWLLRSKSRPDPSSASPPSGREEMLACAHCGLHLPRSEALSGPDGVFCGEAHRRAHLERKPPR